MRLIIMLMLIIGVCLMGSCDAGVTKTRTTQTVSFVQDGPQADQAVCYCSDPANCPCTADGRECLCLPLEARPLATITQTVTQKTTTRSTSRSKPNNGVSMQMLLVGEKQTPLLVVARHPDIVTYTRPPKITTRTVVRTQSSR